MKTNRLCPGHNNIPHKQPGKNLCPAGVDSSIFCLKIGGFFTILNVDFLSRRAKDRLCRQPGQVRKEAAVTDKAGFLSLHPV